MRKQEQRTETQVVEKTVVVSLTCDICGKEYKDKEKFGYEFKNVGEFHSTKVSISSGEQLDWNGGGWEDTFEFDVCPECFRSKLIPWFESQHAKPTLTRIDW